MDSVLMCVHVMGEGGGGGWTDDGRMAETEKILRCWNLIIFTMCHTVN